MSRAAALIKLAVIERLIDENKASAMRAGVLANWQRDREFLGMARHRISSDDKNSFQLLLDEMRNLSQGFASYCDSQDEIDYLVEALFDEVQQLVLSSRE